MKYFSTFTILACLVIFLACGKEQECMAVSIITPCISETFPDSTYTLELARTNNTSLNFKVNSITREEQEVSRADDDLCYIHETLTTRLKTDIENYEISFSYVAQSFGRSFSIHVRNLLNNTRSKFVVYLEEECVISNFHLSEEKNEAFYDTLSINNHSYLNVFKLANDLLNDGVNDDEDGEFEFIYYSIEEGILKLESMDESWEKIN